MKQTILNLSILLFCINNIVCCSNSTEKPTEKVRKVLKAKKSEKKIADKEENKPNSLIGLNTEEEKIKNFLHSKTDTYGWETKANDISLDFFKDGRLHIQGPEGESTMWTGSWKLKDDELTMERPDLEQTVKVKVKIKGENLILNDIVYNRYRLQF